MKVPHRLLSFLGEEDKFFIATHVNPEADAVGSAISLSMALESMGKETVLYDKDPIPGFYDFLPGHQKFRSSISSIKTSEFPLILLDCNSLDRAGLDNYLFKNSAVIDHHETVRDFGDIRWIVPQAAATGLMIFYLLKELGIKITKEIALNLYSAICVDTGTFRYSNTTSEVLRVGAELVEAGADPAYISNNLYETWSKERFTLLIRALNTLEIRNGLAMTFVTRDMCKKAGADPEDTENFSNFPRIMKDIKVSVFFMETADNQWKVSLRSKGEMNVAKIASIFDGGGHKNAAGYNVKGSLEFAKETLLKAISSKVQKPES
ncbi:MAG: bifunctional oligoribonuclease/PAP phosphatase NrnA [Nitrospirota bacterium]